MEGDTGKLKVLKETLFESENELEKKDQKNDVFKSQLPVAMTPYSDKGNTFHFLFYILGIKSLQLYDRMWHVSDHIYICLIWVASYKKQKGREGCKTFLVIVILWYVARA